MAQPVTLSFKRSTFLPNVTREQVWRAIGNWEGVNHELGPILKMSYPERYAKLEDIPADGKSYFTAGISLFGILPIDHHKFAFVGFNAPNSFDERSSNLNMTSWSHIRTLVERDGGVEITDDCSFVPRFRVLGGLLRTIFTWVFKRRHQRLLRRFLSS